jgi:hypothetical protein
MVEDLLDILRITTGRLEFQKRAADLRSTHYGCYRGSSSGRHRSGNSD